jgi:hypothetical protein
MTPLPRAAGPVGRVRRQPPDHRWTAGPRVSARTQATPPPRGRTLRSSECDPCTASRRRGSSSTPARLALQPRRAAADHASDSSISLALGLVCLGRRRTRRAPAAPPLIEVCDQGKLRLRRSALDSLTAHRTPPRPVHKNGRPVLGGGSDAASFHAVVFVHSWSSFASARATEDLPTLRTRAICSKLSPASRILRAWATFSGVITDGRPPTRPSARA